MFEIRQPIGRYTAVGLIALTSGGGAVAFVRDSHLLPLSGVADYAISADTGNGGTATYVQHAAAGGYVDRRAGLPVNHGLTPSPDRFMALLGHSFHDNPAA